MKTRHKAVKVSGKGGWKAAKPRHNKPMVKGGEPTPCAILRRLGHEGIGIAHAGAIMKKAGYKLARGTIAKQIGDGRHGRGEVADISKAELAELITAAPDPSMERWSKIVEASHAA